MDLKKLSIKLNIIYESGVSIRSIARDSDTDKMTVRQVILSNANITAKTYEKLTNYIKRFNNSKNEVSNNS